MCIKAGNEGLKEKEKLLKNFYYHHKGKGSKKGNNYAEH